MAALDFSQHFGCCRHNMEVGVISAGAFPKKKNSAFKFKLMCLSVCQLRKQNIFHSHRFKNSIFYWNSTVVMADCSSNPPPPIVNYHDFISTPPWLPLVIS